MEITRPVEPAQVVEISGIHNQGLPFPMAVGPSHPTVRGGVFVIHVNGAKAARILKDHHDVLRILNDLKRVRHIHGARDTRQIAFDFRIQVHPIGEVFFLLLERLGLVRNRTAFNDAKPGSNGEFRAELPEWAGSRSMAFDVPICRVHGLPDTVQVWFAILCARCSIGGRLSGRRCRPPGSLPQGRYSGRQDAQCHNHGAYKPSSHLIDLPSEPKLQISLWRWYVQTKSLSTNGRSCPVRRTKRRRQ